MAQKIQLASVKSAISNEKNNFISKKIGYQRRLKKNKTMKNILPR